MVNNELKKLSDRKFPSWLVYGITLAFIIFAFYSVLKKKDELTEYGVEIDAVITDFRWGNKVIKNVDYQFIVNNEIITGHGSLSHLPCETSRLLDCVGVKIKIIYSKRDPAINKLILDNGTIPKQYYNLK